MSDELLALSPVPVVPDIRRDIHSFYWVLLSVVLRHTKHNMSSDTSVKPSDACTRVFKQGDSEEAMSTKRNWTWGDWRHLVVQGNAPLTALMMEFGALIRVSMLSPEMPLEYGTVLDVFDRALGRQDWPKSEDDPACYMLPTSQPVKGRVFETPKRKPHARAHDDREVKAKAQEVVSESDSDEAYESYSEAGDPEGSPEDVQDDANVSSRS